MPCTESDRSAARAPRRRACGGRRAGAGRRCLHRPGGSRPGRGGDARRAVAAAGRGAGDGRRRRRRREAKRALPAPKAGRNWAEVRQQAAERLVAANPDITYLGRVPDQLLAIPVLEVELNGDGSVRRIEILREPREAKDTLQDRGRRDPPRRAFRRRVAPAAGRGSSPRPSCSTTPASSSRARSIADGDGHAGPIESGSAQSRDVLQPADALHLGAHRRDPARRRRLLHWTSRRRRRTSSAPRSSSSSRSPTGPTAGWRAS